MCTLNRTQTCSDMPGIAGMFRAQAILQATLIVCFAVAVAVGSRLTKHGSSPVENIGYSKDQHQLVPWPGHRISGTDQGDNLKVCDCEMAPISNHGGLLCDKEGYFIASFESVGHWVSRHAQSSIWHRSETSIYWMSIFEVWLNRRRPFILIRCRACVDKWRGTCSFEPCEMLSIMHYRPSFAQSQSSSSGGCRALGCVPCHVGS